MGEELDIYSISICARLTLALRQYGRADMSRIVRGNVTLVSPDGEIQMSDAIAPAAFRYAQAECLRKLATASGLPLSEGSRTGRLERAGWDIAQGREEFSGMTAASLLGTIIRLDALSDLAGIFGGASGTRSGVTQFAWMVGLPQRVITQQFALQAHSPLPGRREVSGTYAFMIRVEAARIGFNDHTSSYVINQAERARRYQILLSSVLQVVSNLPAIPSSNNLAHLTDCRGYICWTSGVVSAPLVSPLNDDYIAEARRLGTILNRLHSGGGLEIAEFDSAGELAERIADLSERAPNQMDWRSKL